MPLALNRLILYARDVEQTAAFAPSRRITAWLAHHSLKHRVDPGGFPRRLGPETMSRATFNRVKTVRLAA